MATVTGALRRLESGIIRQRLRRMSGVEVDRRAVFHGVPIVTVTPGSGIRLGANSVIVSKASRTALGVTNPSILRTLRAGAEISVGAHSGLSGTVVCAALSVSIGERVLVGSGVLICDTDFHPVQRWPRVGRPVPDPQPSDAVVIADDVFIGARSIILKGVTVGQGAVVGAGSVVTRDVPPGSVVAGNPARPVGAPD